ncbi:hypothetical protein [Vibrio jasicida]|uniref:hypothetical protein n=1 Tax=Vibrio jasicida TaxID=766224 RepID=UPI0005EEDFCD|nr:hypothetical protein [Vibrio jasicida]
MRHCKIIGLLTLVLSGCANASLEQSNVDWITQFNMDTQTREATLDWVIQRDECITQEKESKELFPRNEWFDSLSKEDKIKVVLYINNVKLQACSEQEAWRLERLVDEGNHEKLKETLTVLGAFDWPDESQLEGIDKGEVEQLSKQVGMFNTRIVGEQLKFRD